MQNFKLDVMLKSSDKKIKNSSINFHYYNKQLPGKYFSKITVNDNYLQDILFNKVYICSPELTYLQLSKNFPQIRLMLLAMELCGNYALDLNSKTGFINKIPQATNISKLKSATTKINGLYFGKSEIAQDTLKWIGENSASPAESKLFLLLCGPRKLGLFQVRTLLLNYRIDLSNEASAICKFSSIRPDLCNPQVKLAIEYDSKQFHENVEANQNDKSRLVALQHDGWKVISIVPSELRNYSAFSAIAKDILLYSKQDTRIRNKNFKLKSNTVFREINSFGFQN